jgi:hypothetical protein
MAQLAASPPLAQRRDGTVYLVLEWWPSTPPRAGQVLTCACESDDELPAAVPDFVERVCA